MHFSTSNTTPSRPRFTACLSILMLSTAIYWGLAHTPSTYALEQDEGESDHNWHRIQEEATLNEQDGGITGRESILDAREALDIDANDSPNHGNLSPGQTNTWHYSQSLLNGTLIDQGAGLPSNVTTFTRDEAIQHLDLKKRDAVGHEEQGLHKRQISRQVYISINTCTQPKWTGTADQLSGPPQLTLYIGQPGVQNVGSGGSSSQTTISLVEGYANYTMQTSSDFYLAVAAPSLASNFSGTWTYDVAVSIDGYYHGLNSLVPFLYLVDTDDTSALLVTDDLTLQSSNSTVYQQWMGLHAPLPFTVFAINDADDRDLGISQSYCGMQNIATIPVLSGNATNSSAYITTSMVTRGLKNGPKQQFVFNNLANNTAYDAAVALVGNGVKSGKGVVGGGGTIWQETGWQTKSDGNCRLLYDLQFCSQVAYTVPSNPAFNTSYLGQQYDEYAQALYQNFTYSLMQVQCDTSNDQRYSLARNCTDCQNAYKDWLCAVTLPRCEDFSNQADWLQPRNVGQNFVNDSSLPDEILNTPYQPMLGAPTLPGSPYDQTYISTFATNQSRNPTLIDVTIKPGPYKEVLPCEEICYNLVQSCPAALQFSCPYPGRGFERGYAPRPSTQSVVTCNYFGAVWYIDDARQLTPSVAFIAVVALLAVIVTFI